MAKQSSLVKFRGKVGDLSFSKHRTRGYEVRMPGGADKQRILSDPNFQRTRENMAEFGSAAAMAKLFRLQFNNLSQDYADATFRNRLTALMHRIQKADSVNVRGQRAFLPENSRLLQGFEFNAGSSLSMMFGEQLHVTYNRESGNVSLVIPAFDPQRSVMLLKGATHIQFVLAAAEQTLDREVIPRPTVTQSAYIPLIGLHEEETLAIELPAESPQVVYQLVGIETFQQVNKVYYPLLNNPYNVLTIVDVSIP